MLSKVLWTGSVDRRWGFTECGHIWKNSCFQMNILLHFFSWKLVCSFIFDWEWVLFKGRCMHVEDRIDPLILKKYHLNMSLFLLGASLNMNTFRVTVAVHLYLKSLLAVSKSQSSNFQYGHLVGLFSHHIFKRTWDHFPFLCFNDGLTWKLEIDRIE